MSLDAPDAKVVTIRIVSPFEARILEPSYKNESWEWHEVGPIYRLHSSRTWSEIEQRLFSQIEELTSGRLGRGRLYEGDDHIYLDCYEPSDYCCGGMRQSFEPDRSVNFGEYDAVVFYSHGRFYLVGYHNIQIWHCPFCGSPLDNKLYRNPWTRSEPR